MSQIACIVSSSEFVGFNSTHLSWHLRAGGGGVHSIESVPICGKLAYFSFHGNEYFIATDKVETAVSANDAIVELVGVTNIHHPANAFGLVTLHI